MRFVIEFMRNHALLQVADQPVWRVISGGSRTYVDALLGRFDGTLLLYRPVRSVQRLFDRVVIADATGDRATFDHVILACHADQALRLLADASPIERALARFAPAQRRPAAHGYVRPAAPSPRVGELELSRAGRIVTPCP
jgi:predicted NAD/FAD-binding protein